MFEDIFNIWVMLIAVVPILALIRDKQLTGSFGIIGKIIIAEIALYLLCLLMAGYNANPNDFFICYQSSVIIALIVHFAAVKKNKNT